MPDPKRGDGAPREQQKEEKPAWTPEGKVHMREWVEKRWPTATIPALIEKALRLTEKGPCTVRETGTWWQKGNVHIDFKAEQKPKKGRPQEACEDRVFCLPDRGLFVVNDGIGGREESEIAAALLGSITVAFIPKEKAPDDSPKTAIERAVVATEDIIQRHINDIREKEGDKWRQAPGTCTAIVYIHPESRGKSERIRATIGGLGDVEIYRLKPDGSVEFVYQGARIKSLRNLPQEEARSAHGSNVVATFLSSMDTPRPKDLQQKNPNIWKEMEIAHIEDVIDDNLSLQEIVLEPGEALLAATDGLGDNMVIRRNDENWRKRLGDPNIEETLEEIVTSCKKKNGTLDIDLLNARLLQATDESRQRKSDDRSWTLIAPTVKFP